MMPTTLCFDLDNTLLDDDASLRACVLRVCRDIAGRLPPFDAEAMTKHYIDLSDNYWLTLGHYDPAALPDVRLRLWAETLAHFGCNDAAIAVTSRDAYANYRYEYGVLYEETLDVLSALAGRYKLAVITNGVGDQQRARLRHAGIDGYFEAIVASTDVGVGKPDPAIFEHTLGLLGANACNAWHIGDSLVADIAGAHNADLEAAVWLNRNGAHRLDTDPIPHHEVSGLTGLLDLLEVPAAGLR